MKSLFLAVSKTLRTKIPFESKNTQIYIQIWVSPNLDQSCNVYKKLVPHFKSQPSACWTMINCNTNSGFREIILKGSKSNKSKRYIRLLCPVTSIYKNIKNLSENILFYNKLMVNSNKNRETDF